MSSLKETNTFTGAITWTATDGDKGGFGANNWGDLYLINPARGMPTPRRALVAYTGQVLVLNFGNDFAGGTRLEGAVTMPALPKAPVGARISHVVIGEDGKLYRKE